MHLFNTKQITQQPFVAVSGGVDSVVLLDLMLKAGKDISVAHYIHAESQHSSYEAAFVAELCFTLRVPITFGMQSQPKDPKVSLEAYWRSGRMSFLTSLSDQVLTGHTLDDAVEWYLFTSLHGEGHHMPFRHDNVVRPLLTTTKATVLEYATANGLTWLEDPDNSDMRRSRNKVRKNIVPHALDVNPGLYTVVRKRLTQKFTEVQNHA